MDPTQLRQTLEALHAYSHENTSPMSGVVRVLVQLAQSMDGPLRLLGPPTPCDIQTFNQHLSYPLRRPNPRARRAAPLTCNLPPRPTSRGSGRDPSCH